MSEPNFENNKLGGPGLIVQIDESMLNFKCKSHRDKAVSNKTNALCIVEVKNGITRAFATFIFNKYMKTLLPNIASQVIPGSIFYTDEHKSYASLFKNRSNHIIVCHKYEFVDKTRVFRCNLLNPFLIK
ncbi:hypothetical protein H312_02574 [Anncaliia algerae PRA339]|uniref:ISXO2-like transposase domain-containing protein n=1 Tax=Anncaliia algerae PRA339 TaxID=1288291 RepID=A0A059EYT7_9MICR|nr:hypothetical protein H312_02574 [Anncaliia algerae PRA339]